MGLIFFHALPALQITIMVFLVNDQRDGHQHRVTVTRDCIDTIVSPDNENDVLETCRELKINTQRSLDVTLFIYQESLHDARSTKYKSPQ
jgi:hypothetical protein